MIFASKEGVVFEKMVESLLVMGAGAGAGEKKNVPGQKQTGSAELVVRQVRAEGQQDGPLKCRELPTFFSSRHPTTSYL